MKSTSGCPPRPEPVMVQNIPEHILCSPVTVDGWPNIDGRLAGKFSLFQYALFDDRVNANTLVWVNCLVTGLSRGPVRFERTRIVMRTELIKLNPASVGDMVRLKATNPGERLDMKDTCARVRQHGYEALVLRSTASDAITGSHQ